MTNDIMVVLGLITLIFVLTLTSLLYARARREFISGYRGFVCVLLSVSVWTLFFVLKMASSGLTMRLLFTRLEYVGILCLPIALAALAEVPLFSVTVARRWSTVCCALLIAAYFSFMWFNPGNLYYRAQTLINEGTNREFLRPTYGPAFWVFQVLITVAIVALTWRICVRMARAGARPGRILLVCFAVATPLLATALYVAHITPIDGTVPSFMISGALLYLCFVRYGIFDSVSYVRRNILSLLGEAIIVLGKDDRVEYMNPAAAGLAGGDQLQAHGLTMEALFPGYRMDGDHVSVCDIQRPGESTVRLRFETKPLSGERDDAAGTMVMVTNVTEFSEVGKRLDYLLEHDNHTGLYNAQKLQKIMAEYEVSHPSGLAGTVLCEGSIVNLDQLSTLMTSEQRAALESAAAAFIVESVQPGHVVARMGDNQFCVFSNGQPFVLSELIPRLVSLCVARVPFESRTVTLEFKLGLYVIEDGVDTKAALGNVTYALRAALSGSRDQLQVYDKSIKLQHNLHQSLVSTGGAPDFERDFHLEFQPVMDMRTGEVVGAEAFMRWKHPTLGWISPKLFISVLEVTGNMVSLGHAMMEKALEALAQLQRAMGDTFFLSINVSRWQIEDSFMETLSDTLRRHEVKPNTLVLEMKEEAIRDRVDGMRAYSSALHALGAKLAIDGFNWRNASFPHIVELQCDMLKIDTSFLPNGVQRPERELIMKILQDLCEKLNVQIVAVHVETVGDLKAIERQGLPLAQGYIFGNAMSQQAFIAHCQTVKGRMTI